MKTATTLHIHFRIGTGKQGALCPLVIRLTIGNHATAEYPSGVMVHPLDWQGSRQMCVGRSRQVGAINARLRLIQQQHRELLRGAVAAFRAGEGEKPCAGGIARLWLDSMVVVG